MRALFTTSPGRQGNKEQGVQDSEREADRRRFLFRNLAVVCFTAKAWVRHQALAWPGHSSVPPDGPDGLCFLSHKSLISLWLHCRASEGTAIGTVANICWIRLWHSSYRYHICIWLLTPPNSYESGRYVTTLDLLEIIIWPLWWLPMNSRRVCRLGHGFNGILRLETLASQFPSFVLKYYPSAAVPQCRHALWPAKTPCLPIASNRIDT